MTYKVCIDPGHGGSDPGARNKNLGYLEKDLALKVGLKVADLLRSAGVEVIMTRDGDYNFYPGNQGADLTHRAQISNRAGCHAYVSIHLNAFNGVAHGVETYSFNGAKTPQLAEAIHWRVLATGQYSLDRKTKTENFAVLRETNCIAALIEMAFIDNDKDVMFVVNGVDIFAHAIAAGICDYLKVKAPAASTTSDQRQAGAANSGGPKWPDLPIMGAPYLGAEDLAAFLLKANPDPKIDCTAKELAEAFIEEGRAEGVRGDVAFCQSLIETGYFRYGGQVLPEQNNYAGIGATNNSPAGFGAWFKSPREGVRAQIQHLKAYASKEPLAGACVDPRFAMVTRGSAPNWGDLSGQWAWPGFDRKKYPTIDAAKAAGAHYGMNIIDLYYTVKKGAKPKPAPAIDATPDGITDDAVAWAVSEGYLRGDPDGNLRLGNNITRKEFIAVLKRYHDKQK